MNNIQTPTLTTGVDRETANKIFDLRDTRPTTANDYKYAISAFLSFTDGKLHRDSFLDFKRSLSDRSDISVSTKNKYLATAKIFLKEISRQSGVPDTTLGIKSFTQSKKHKRDGLHEKEIATLTEAVRQLEDTPTTARLRAILALLVFQGLRQIEIVRLDVSDLDFANKTALIHGKARDDKEAISLLPETVEALKHYVKTNRVADGALFISQSNNSRSQRLTTRGLRNLIKETLGNLGINKTTHGFRHYFTTRLLEAYGSDLLSVARYTRHKSVSTLQVYDDRIKAKADLPRFFGAFNGVSFVSSK